MGREFRQAVLMLLGLTTIYVVTGVGLALLLDWLLRG